MLQLGYEEHIQASISGGPFDDIIDPRLPDEEATTGPIEDLVDLSVDTRSCPRC